MKQIEQIIENVAFKGKNTKINKTIRDYILVRETNIKI
jgi:hypothetical protein